MQNQRLTELFGSDNQHLIACQKFWLLYLRNRTQMYIAHLEYADAFANWLLPAPLDKRLASCRPDWSAPAICSRCCHIIGVVEGGYVRASCTICRMGSVLRDYQTEVDGYQLQRIASVLHISYELCEFLCVEALIDCYLWDTKDANSGLARSTPAA